MPKDTFLKLSKEKQQKVISSAKKEFSRVPLQDVSIKNIVENAEIARGSFYQYFESKEDLLIYILKEKIDEINQYIQNKIEKEKPDLINSYIYLYDLMIENFVYSDNKNIFKQIFENSKLSDESTFDILKCTKPHNIAKYYEIIDKTNLNMKDKKDFEIICNMLDMITKKAVIKNFKSNSKEDSKNEFLMQIEYLKNGIIKKEEKNV